MARALTFADQFDPGAVDPRLIEILDAAAANYGDYGVEATSGYRKGPRQHGRHAATDIRLRDKKTRQALANYQDPSTFSTYEGFAKAARKAQQQLYPDLDKQFRWGGYFGGGKDKYGALDQMHFDLGGSDTLGMAGGSWEGGLNPEQAKIWGLPAGSSTAQVDAKMQAAGYTPQQRRDAIASIESAGSGDYSAKGAWTGDPQEGRHQALGRYQVMDNNVGPWAEHYLKRPGVTPEAFLKDPQLQDQLFDAVYSGEYVPKYGERGAASKWFTGSELEPNRTDVNGKLTGGTYADRYMAALTGTPTAQHPPNPQTGTRGFVAPGAPTTGVPVAVAAEPAWKKVLADMGKSGAAIGSVGKTRSMVKPVPEAARIDQGEFPTIDPAQADAQRQQLAQALARLNSGRLV